MASSIVGNLIVRLAADIGSYESGLRKAERVSQRRLRRIEKRVEHFQRRFGAAMKTAAGTATVATAGLVALAHRQSDVALQAQSMARALGTSTGQLQALGYAFTQVGGDADKARDIIKDLQDKLGDASLNQGGELYDTLENIGLSAEQLQQKSPVDQLVAIGNAIEGLPRAQQVNVLESISDDATRLLPLLHEGGRELKKYAQQARDLGVAQDQAINQKMVESAHTIKQFEGRLEGVANQITIGVAPAIDQLGETLSDPKVQHGLTRLSQAFVKIIQWGAQATSAVASFTDTIAQKIADIGDRMDGPNGPIERTKARIAELQKRLHPQTRGGIVGAAAAPGDQLVPNRAKLEKELAEQKRILADYKKQKAYFDRLNDRPERVAGIDVQANAPKPPKPPKPPTAAKPPEMKHVDVPRRPEISTQGERDRQALGAIRRDTRTQTERINQAYQRRVAIVKRAYNAAGDRADLLARLQKQHAEDLKRISGDSYGQMSAFARRAASNIQDTLGETLESTLKGHFDGILGLWAQTLEKMAAQAAAQNLGNALLGKQFGQTGELGGLAGTIGSGIASVASRYLGGGSGTTSIGARSASGIANSGSISGQLISGMLATGGPAQAGNAYIVGERGPELFTPGQSGTVTPAAALFHPSRAGPIAPAANDVAVTVNVINQGQPVEAERQTQRRGPNGDQVIDVHVKQSLARLAGSGELDSVFAPYNTRRQGQI